jgi:hypothetical protein
MSNAFAPISRARPCPTLGRPVRLRVSPIDCGPAVLRKPFGLCLATDALPSRARQSSGCRFTLAVSSFRLCARLGFSIPSRLLWPARHYPRFWISCSSSEHERDFNPPEQHAAQRTVCLIHIPTAADSAPPSVPDLVSQERRKACFPVPHRFISEFIAAN